MPAGKMFLQARRVPRKARTVGNKQLLSRVRRLEGQDGERISADDHLVSAEAVAAAGSRVDYFTDIGALFNAALSIQHYYMATIKLIPGAAGTVRIVYGWDEHFDGTNLIISEIFDTGTDSASAYNTVITQSLKEGRHKNNNAPPRAVIVKDMTISMEAGQSKLFRVKLPMHNRKNQEGTSSGRFNFLPFLAIIADEAAITYSVACEYYFTALDT